ncbi:NSFL1 cofactor p47 [Lycorma delicatula]|uniref:NSFL1 cofactor p47 n=1 Tax=Lycorma delicatula TaxID=130591 RepID=UPI003F519978
MGDKDALLSQFADVTGVDTERARFYLESAAWQLEVALASFYETDGDGEVADTGASSDAPEVLEDSQSQPPDVVSSSPKPKPKLKPKTNSKFATVSSLKKEGVSSDEEEGQAFYAGGSEHSGQQVIGPGKKKVDFVSEMFKSVKEHGAEVVEPAPSRAPTFSGTGYRLGQSSNDTEVVASPSDSQVGRQSNEVTLKLWREGFSVDEGPLRHYNDPANREFLDYVKRGLVPLELVQAARGGEVHLNMEDHHHEDFTPPKFKVKAFAGKGHVLGSPSPKVAGMATVINDDDRLVNEEEARQMVKVNDSIPSTTVQIRLADGSRLVASFNQTHTIADVRRYIITARPQYVHQTFALLTSFPSKELTDDSQTLVEAGILNSALLQRIK